MLKLNYDVKNQLFKANQLVGYDNYYHDFLLPIMKAGKWDDVEKMDVLHMPNGEAIRFGQDVWDMRSLNDDLLRTISFTIEGRKLERNITNEIKAFSLALMLTNGAHVEGYTVKSYNMALRKLAHHMLNNGWNSFSDLNDDNLKEFAQAHPDLFLQRPPVTALNALLSYYEELPFELYFSKQDNKKLGIKLKEQQQNLVIPPRIYTAMLYTFSADVGSVLPHLSQLEREIERMIDIEKGLARFEPFVVGDMRFTTKGQFKGYLRDLDMKSKVLCLMLSGMRVDELHSMHPDYGAQSYEYNSQKIFLFTTRQSKITKGIQTKEDQFVTTQTGHDAFRVLTTVHRPLLSLCACNNSYFVSLRETISPKTLEKGNWASRMSDNVNIWLNKHMDSALNTDDTSFLRVTNPSNTNFEEGKPFKFKPHQTRRSFAFYMIGLELMAYPQLKQQLSHLSSAMTRHYANNATYWGALRYEIESERTLQQSTILARVYERIANKERVAGGKGRALNTIAGNSDFFDRDNN
ncbi:hypothetical protein H5071_12020, partial [Shewanella sp. SR41-2]|nr:hypothetical protein [Shewanella sp. SR41-2]